MITRKPDYKVSALNKRTECKGPIGAAWINDDKTISVILDEFISLTQDGHLLITLFPAELKPKKKKNSYNSYTENPPVEEPVEEIHDRPF